MAPATLSHAARLGPPDILRVVQQDAEAAYGDLSGYRITLILRQDGWHYYDLTEEVAAGGGPHYVIDPATGTIVSKAAYYQ
jgi:hypothetical protein